MTADGKVLAPSNVVGPISGTDFMEDVNDEVKALNLQEVRSFVSISMIVNAITAACAVPITAYAAGQKFSGQWPGANTGAVTIAIDGVAGTKNVRDADDAVLGAGATVAGRYFLMEYDGIHMRVIAGLTNTSGLLSDRAEISLRQSQNTAGGTSSATPKTKYPFNQILQDDIGLSMAASVITVPAGTYDVEARVPFNNAGSYQVIYLHDVTNNVNFDILKTQGNSSCQLATLKGRITLAASTDIQLNYSIQTAQATDGLGVASNKTGEFEYYGALSLNKLA